MIQINRLEIDAVNEKIYVSASIMGGNYYTNCYLTKIKLCTAEQFDPLLSTDPQEFIYENTLSSFNEKVHDWVIPLSDLSPNIDPNKDLLFVYIEGTSDFAESTPEELKVNHVISALYNKEYLHSRGICMSRHEKPCQPSTAYIDFILNWNLFHLALDSGNWDDVILSWNRFVGESNNNTCIGNKCSCNG